ncbi:hypothetical protein EXE58_02700 [Nocardioides seonyuensis]|uniref:Glycoside hydrolase n=1 Tax=Nocardioides seonyuensis TaxID=2518371 RepID=A0A4P7IBN9_9ACTN|nr:family 43 glycosylhydrolase [Nocardioides seonyuensis]QBX54484.1 hypothetical protein EXE58_02700 [Nocardioides seonyuensis]
MSGWGRAIVVALVATLLALPTPAPARTTDDVPHPVLNADFPDPSVVATGHGLVGYSTGDRVPHAWSPGMRSWTRGGAVLTRRPGWAVEGGIWAVDVARAGRQWLLYYAVPVAGIVKHGRCIGVARSSSARGPFRPVGRRPLVCPSYADAPTALDPLLPRDRTLPRAGVIDPSLFVDDDGSRYLLYKTDRIPSSIRVLPLSQGGTRAAGPSQEIMRSDGVIENPVVARRPEGYVLLLSEGDWTRCSYRTVWFRSGSLLDWSVRVGGVLLDRRTTGLCGAGGADLVTGADGATQVFLHGWTCYGTDRPCRGAAKWDHRRRARGMRALYAARLGWLSGVPVVQKWYLP